jgi:small ligand-binding sensory domain FIST
LPVDAERQQFAPGKYIVRNITRFDPERGIVAVAAEIVAGQKLIFTLRDGAGARRDLKRVLEEQAQNWQASSPAFGLYFNCVGPGSGLYCIPDIDTSYVNQYLESVPIIGFFTGCEIAPIRHQAWVHQYSGVLVLIGEKNLQ